MNRKTDGFIDIAPMYVLRNISWKIVIQFAWKNLIFFTLYGAAVIYAHHELQHNDIDFFIPYAPLGTIGIAVAFYVGFKNNQSYDRFWEGRKIWGGIVNYSRTWGNQVMNYLENADMDDAELQATKKRLIYRHVAWINALRLQLRKPSSFSTDFAKRGTKRLYQGAPGGEHWKSDVGPFLSDTDINYCKGYKNVATQLVRIQGKELKHLVKNGNINEFEHINMMETLEESYNLQGKCERIKNTPLPRQYAYFSYVFIWIFLLVLPFGLVGLYTDMGHGYIWLTLPSYVLISWIFITMEKVGGSSEDPFENFVNDVPMTALCRTIEIDLREMLGETEVPEKIQHENGVLM